MALTACPAKKRGSTKGKPKQQQPAIQQSSEVDVADKNAALKITISELEAQLERKSTELERREREIAMLRKRCDGYNNSAGPKRRPRLRRKVQPAAPAPAPAPAPTPAPAVVAEASNVSDTQKEDPTENEVEIDRSSIYYLYIILFIHFYILINSHLSTRLHSSKQQQQQQQQLQQEPACLERWSYFFD